jgi:superfamily II DNA or RNA helicase
MRRFFSRAERRALFLADGGVCRYCKTPLYEGWHADHVVAHATGGTTDVSNGQGLCPNCNLKKGTSDMSVRKWQEKFENDFAQKTGKGQADYLLVACPGAGKTSAAIRAADQLLEDGVIERIVVVVPTEYLKYQWAQSAHGTLNLNPNWNGDSLEGRDYEGVAVTYQSLATQKDCHRALCSRRRTLVIFDEIHHLGNGSGTWGTAAKYAFQNARHRLGLSGTPFRSDGAQIPFVRYDADPDIEGARRSVADFSYTYVQAMNEEICRKVVFPNFDGNVAWIGRHGEQQATISEVLTPALDSERMRTFLDPDGKAMRLMCEQGNVQLTKCRETGHRDAGGLIITSDIREAEKFARLMSDIAGERAMLVVSEHEEAATVDAYRNSSARWLVAVRMVSEGVDIKRLRVLVYATYCTTELFFRQAIGRVIRKIDGLKVQPAYVLIPEHPVIRQLAAQIVEEVDSVVIDPEEKEPKERTSADSINEGYVFQPLYSEAIPSDVLVGSDAISPAEMAEARDIKRDGGFMEIPEEEIARLARILRQPHRQEEHQTEDPCRTATAEEPAYQEQERLRKDCARKASYRDRLLGNDPPGKAAHMEWRGMGGMPQATADLADLRRKDEWLNSEIASIADHRANGG